MFSKLIFVLALLAVSSASAQETKLPIKGGVIKVHVYPDDMTMRGPQVVIDPAGPTMWMSGRCRNGGTVTKDEPVIAEQNGDATRFYVDPAHASNRACLMDITVQNVDGRYTGTFVNGAYKGAVREN